MNKFIIIVSVNSTTLINCDCISTIKCYRFFIEEEPETELFKINIYLKDSKEVFEGYVLEEYHYAFRYFFSDNDISEFHQIYDIEGIINQITGDQVWKKIEAEEKK